MAGVASIIQDCLLGEVKQPSESPVSETRNSNDVMILPHISPCQAMND